MRSKDQEFTIGKGHEVRGGKSHYPDSMRLVIPKDRAIQLAQSILRGYENARPEDTHLLEIPLFGQFDK
jgi:hypothetical protein